MFDRRNNLRCQLFDQPLDSGEKLHDLVIAQRVDLTMEGLDLRASDADNSRGQDETAPIRG